MFINFRKPPYELLVYEALDNRLYKNHRIMPKITKEIKKRRAGYRGERYLDYFLGLLPRNKYSIFCDLRLEYSDNHFQIDSLVNSPKLTLLIEVKDWEGTIKYDPDKNQILQIKSNSTMRHQDPVLQADRQKEQLERWLIKHNGKLSPIEILVVMSNKEAILAFDSKNETTEKIIYIDSVLEKIKEIEKKYSTKIIGSKDIKKVAKLVVDYRSYKKIDVLTRHNISSNELIRGVQCPKCGKFIMTRKHRTWYCPSCKIHSSDAHIKAITEYLLIHTSITNKLCREFLGLSKKYTRLVSKLLNNMNLKFVGTTSNRKYYLPV
jgi:ribosomal protein L37AE/L43A